MKLKDIVPANSIYPSNSSNEPVLAPISGATGEGPKVHPEVMELLSNRIANLLFSCAALAHDEIDFANFIVGKLDVDPHYYPSETLLLAIQSLNKKVADDSRPYGQNRTQ